MSAEERNIFMKHYHDWKVVLYLDGERYVNGRFDAVRALAWFRWLHAWWSKRPKPGREVVQLELWRGKRCLISLLVHLLPLVVARHFLVLALKHSNLL